MCFFKAIGVHCAEGRGRTGVMCACYLIYYHDLKPWDAIRVMRRQRPGTVVFNGHFDFSATFLGKKNLSILIITIKRNS